MSDDALRAALEAIPVGSQWAGTGTVQGWSRYDTDDEMVLHIWRSGPDQQGQSWDFRAALASQPQPETPLDEFGNPASVTADGHDSYRCCADHYPGLASPQPETPAHDEMLLGADPTEEWVADAWAERDDRLGGAS